ncbi:MAG: AarF/UbiB family protein [Oscillospiraceae bacterium]
MDSIESYLRKLIVASVGAADLGCEKLGKLLDECVARGEVTVEKGRVLNEELKRTCKQAVTKDEAEKPAVDVDAMSADEREALLPKAAGQEGSRLMAGPAAQLDEAKRFAEIVAILQKHHLVQGLTPEKVRDIFVDLGPTFVKFGQILSMRSDILPKEYCAALETLRTDVTPMPLTEVEDILTQAYARPWQEVFSDIGIRPLGSASIAQVHAATLTDGQRVVVKVQRPDLYDIMSRDVRLLKRAAALLKYTPLASALDFTPCSTRCGTPCRRSLTSRSRRTTSPVIQASQRRRGLRRLPGHVPEVVHEKRARHGVHRRPPDRRCRRPARRRV